MGYVLSQNNTTVGGEIENKDFEQGKYNPSGG